MVLEIYLVTLSGVIFGQLAPGPNLLAVAGAALGTGRRQALATATGVALAVFVWVALAALGLAAVLSVYPGLLTLIKLLGGVYLLWIAVRALRAAAAGKSAVITAGPAMTARAAFWRGVLINLTNPKSAMMWGAVATFMVGAGLTPLGVLGFAPLGAATAFAVYAFYAFALSGAGPRRIYARFQRVFDGLFGAAFGAVGGALLADGLRAAAP